VVFVFGMVIAVEIRKSIAPLLEFCLIQLLKTSAIGTLNFCSFDQYYLKGT
jgi:hypothetical protein